MLSFQVLFLLQLAAADVHTIWLECHLGTKAKLSTAMRTH